MKNSINSQRFTYSVTVGKPWAKRQNRNREFFLFLLLVTVPPSIDGGNLETVQVMENHTAYLSCPVTGIPRPSIIWYKDGVPLFDAVYPNVRQLNAGQQLEVRHVRSDDEAILKCQAGNVAGQTVKRFKLKVLGASVGSTNTVYPRLVLQNDVFIIYCIEY